MSLSLIIKLALLAVFALILVTVLLFSAAKFFVRRKVGEIAETVEDVLRPETIRLEPLPHAEWFAPGLVVRRVLAFRKMGFRAIGSYGIPELPDVRLVALGHPRDHLGAMVFEHAKSGVSCHVVARYRSGGTLTVSTSTGLARPGLSRPGLSRPGHEKIILKRSTPPKKLCATLFKNVVSEELLPVHPRNFARFFEKAYAEEAAWQREHGTPSEPVVRDPELDALSEPLFQRLKARDHAGVKGFLGLGFSPEGRDPRGRTPLMTAVSTGDPVLVRALLDGGADPNSRAPGAPGNPPVDAVEMIGRAEDAAAASGDGEAGKLLKGFGQAIHALGGPTEALVTPLTLAIETGVPEIVSALLNAGANLEGPGIPPLHFASQEGDLDMVRAIVEAGADVHHRDDDGMTPLHYAAMEGHAEVVEYLVSAGADVNQRFGKETPVTLAAEAGATEVVELLELYVKPKQIKRARKILEETGPGGNVRARRLMNAAMNGRAPMVRKLLATGLHPDALEHDDGGETTTALMLATQGGHVESMRALIEAGADVNREDDGGEPVIARALRTHFMEDEDQQGEAIRLLVRHSAILDHLDADERAVVDRFVHE